jgi:uncharacterized protein (TIGR01777 family)
MKVLISGATGLIGSALTRSLEASGHTCIALSRRDVPQKTTLRWDPERGEIDMDALAALGRLDAVVHLAGENIAENKWTADVKRRIRDSRVVGTYTLSSALASLPEPPKSLLSASAVGYYGNREGEDLSEASAPGDDFLATICRDWEAASGCAAAAGIRVVSPRIGVVMSVKGAALMKLLPLFRAGVGGPLGNGRQWMSWISLTDTVGAFEFLLANEELRGPFNLTAPEPVTNAEFARTLGKALHRPAILPAPAFALRLMLGREKADALLLSGQRVLPRRLLDAGFVFRYPTLLEALRAELSEA